MARSTKNITTVTERGQISVPANLRKLFRLKTGTPLLWEATSNNTMVLTIVENKKPAGAKAMLGFAKRIGSPSKTTAQWMKELREGER